MNASTFVQNKRAKECLPFSINMNMISVMDPTYTYVQAQLKRRKDQLIKVAAGAEVSLRTIYNLRDGKSVRHVTLMKVHDFLKKNARKVAL